MKMSFSNMTLCFFLLLCLTTEVRAGPRKVVRIYDLIPEENPVEPIAKVYAACRSKDDDLGVWGLIMNQMYSFHFRVNFGGTTLYWCNFSWGRNHLQSFQVFNAESDDRYCNWQVKTDGFYFANGEFPKNSDFKKKYDWKTRTLSDSSVFGNNAYTLED